MQTALEEYATAPFKNLHPCVPKTQDSRLKRQETQSSPADQKDTTDELLAAYNNKRL